MQQGFYNADKLANINNFQSLNKATKKSSKAGVPLNERVVLEKVLGFTIQSNVCVAQSCDGTLAYLAGCVVVIYSPHSKYQEFIASPAKKALTSVAFSTDGKLIATGESGHDPKLRIWDIKDKCQLCEFGGHKFSIQCVGFLYNPTTTLAISIGSLHDMDVNIWNVKTKLKASSNKISQPTKGLSFSQHGDYFVTVGNRHCKFWYLTLPTTLPKEAVPLKGRPALLGEKKTENFCDVVCGNEAYSHLTYAITTNGTLCELNENRVLARFIDLQVDRAYSIHADNEFLFIGCSNGITLIYLKETLEFFASLPRPHYLGVDVSKGLNTSHITDTYENGELKYPDCIALRYDKFNSILTTFYNDHSFYVWDLADLNRIKKLDSHLYHSATCWSLDIFTSSYNYDNIRHFKAHPVIPLDSLISCGNDNTIRIWAPFASQQTQKSPVRKVVDSARRLRRNIYSRELLKVVYVDGDISALCDRNEQVLDTSDYTSKANDQGLFNPKQPSLTDPSGLDTSKQGIRSLKISANSSHLATGDRSGNLRVYDLQNLDLIYMINAHQGEILDLDYSQPESDGSMLLATSARDRTIRVFSVTENHYELLQTLEDHSAAITAVKFCFSHIEQQLYLTSCGFDKSLMLRSGANHAMLKSNSTNSFRVSMSTRASSQPINANNQFVRTSYVVEKQSFYDLKIEPNNNFIYTISQDRMVRAYSVKDGKKIKKFRGSLNEDGYLSRMAIDLNGELLATSCSDKYIYIWDLNTNECIAYIYGHSEVVSDLKFTSDNQHLISVGDGCIFFWNLSHITSSASMSSNIIMPLQRHNSTPSPHNSIPHTCKATYKQTTPMAQPIVVAPSQPPRQIVVKSKEPEVVETTISTKKMPQSRSYTSNISGRQLGTGFGLTGIEDDRFYISSKFTQSVTNFTQPQLDEPSDTSHMPAFHSSYSFDASGPSHKVSPRTRACWGPDINMEFAIADDDIQAIDLSQEIIAETPILVENYQASKRPVQKPTSRSITRKPAQVSGKPMIIGESTSAHNLSLPENHSRVQSANTMLNDAIETNQKVSKHKCTIL